MATLRELIVKIAFKIDDAVLKKSTAKTNEILSKQKKLFQKNEEDITKSKQTAHDRRKKLEMNYSDWWNKELSKRSKKEQQADQAKKQAFRDGVSGLQDFGMKAIGVATAIQVAFSAVAFAIIKVNDRINMGVARVQTATGGSQKQAKGRFKELLALSTETGQDVETVTSLHNRISMSSKDLGANPESTMRAVKTVSKLAILGGTPTSSQQGGLLQLGQALGSATVQADEYRSIVEQLPAVHQAVAKSMGMTASKLQNFIKNAKTTGSITGRELFDAILKAEEDATKAFEKFPITFQRIQNKFMNSFMDLGLALEEQLEPANKFFDKLFNKMNFLSDFLIKNKAIVGKVIEGIFATLSGGLDLVIGTLKNAQGIIDFIKANDEIIMPILIGFSTALLGIFTLMKIMMIPTILRGLIPALIAMGQAMWASLGPWGLGAGIALGLIAGLTYLVVKFDLVTKSIKAMGDAWRAVQGLFGGGEVKPLKGLTGTAKPMTRNTPKEYGKGNFNPLMPKVGGGAGSKTTNNSVSIYVNGSKDPIATGKAVKKTFDLALAGKT
jgi:tape measure domain-containing protein